VIATCFGSATQQSATAAINEGETAANPDRDVESFGTRWIFGHPASVGALSRPQRRDTDPAGLV
jgi:hypothetical protein